MCDSLLSGRSPSPVLHRALSSIFSAPCLPPSYLSYQARYQLLEKDLVKDWKGAKPPAGVTELHWMPSSLNYTLKVVFFLLCCSCSVLNKIAFCQVVLSPPPPVSTTMLKETEWPKTKVGKGQNGQGKTGNRQQEVSCRELVRMRHRKGARLLDFINTGGISS